MTFAIYDSPVEAYKYIIINKDYYAIGDKIAQINKELSLKKFSGNVLLNTRTSANKKMNQYSEVYFDGKRIIINTLKTIRTVDMEIKKIVSSCLREKRTLN